MNISALPPARKWLCAIFACGQTAAVGVIALVLCAGPAPAIARSARGGVDALFGGLFNDRPLQDGRRRSAARPAAKLRPPMPKPRPADAPQGETMEATPLPEARPAQAGAPAGPQAAPQSAPPEAARPAQVAVPAPPSPSPPVPSPCRTALTEQVAIAPSIADITGPGACGGTDLVRLEAIVVPGAGRVSLKPAATMRCEMATAVAGWIRHDMATLATTLGASLAELDNFDSFDCRGRNRVASAKLSEHGRANALDVRGLKLANGQMISFTERATPRETRETILHSVCQRFTTVLGPGSDGYHEDHVHLDIAVRRGGYRICQWEISEPMPLVAPLMPAERPAEAPPRDVALRETAPQPAATQPDPSAVGAGPESAPQQPAKNGRKRRSTRF